MSKTPCIPMTKYHQELILSGRKTTTLRAKRFEPGVYRMFSRGAGSLGYLRVTGLGPKPLTPSRCEGSGLDALVWSEGYSSTAAFFATLEKLRLDPDKPYWLHFIEPCKEPVDEQSG